MFGCVGTGDPNGEADPTDKTEEVGSQSAALNCMGAATLVLNQTFSDTLRGGADCMGSDGK
jgi:hypothetical protein